MPGLEILLELDSELRMKTSRKIINPSIIYYILLTGMLVIGLFFLYDAIMAYTVGDVEAAGFYSIMGAIGIGVSIYMVTMMKKKTSTREIPLKVITTIECKKCGLKKLREFMKGDYALKNVEICSKCNESMTITAIYTEKVKK